MFKSFLHLATILSLLGLSLPLKAATLSANNLSLSNFLMSDPNQFLNQFTQELPISVTINPGALGFPNPQTYLQQLQSPLSQLQLTTPFSLNGGQGTLTQILQTLNGTQDPFLLDVAVDGQMILTGQGNNSFSETVVLPFGLGDKYFRQGVSDVVKTGGLEGGLSEDAQQKILEALVLANNNQQKNETQALNNQQKANDSNFLIPALDNLSNHSQSLASRSEQISLSSHLTDTSFQLLRSISEQLGIESRQTANTSAQFTRLGEILTHHSQQLANQSKQFETQQKTATQLLETAKQQQVLDAMQALTQSEQLKLLDESATAQNRLQQAPFHQSSSLSGVLIMPINSNQN